MTNSLELAQLTSKCEDSAAASTTGLQSKQQNPPSPIRQFQRWIGVLMIFAVGSLYFFVEKEPSDGSGEQDVERKIPLAQCPAFCQARATQLEQHHGGNYLDNEYLVTAVSRARTKFHEKLQRDYGPQAFAAMFVDKTTKQVVGKHALYSANRDSDISYNKLKRKLQMKVLQVQIAVLDEQKNLEGCDCTQLGATSTRRGRRRGRRHLEEAQQQHQIVLPEIPDHYGKFVWSTGGHSAAAAHGNLYNESYTSYLQYGVHDLFHSVGIQFLGRNYAMGGMDSAPQLALCNEAVYGQDADVISWDFGMTDGKAHWKSALYASRAGVHANRPVHASINMAGRNYKPRNDAVKEAEDAGVPTLVMHPELEEQIVQGIPDVHGMPREEAEKIGPFARDFKCKNALEKEEPCGNAKYNNDICPNRKFKASWHPGWRQHALTGNTIALFFTETMVDAMQTLPSGMTPHQAYAQLKAEEDEEYKAFFATTVPDETQGLVSTELVAAGLKSQEIFRGKAICHTALLPAQTRYLGILTESAQKGEVHGYDTGVEEEYAAKSPPTEKDKGNMTLVYEQKVRQFCDVTDLNIDYKDFFYATQDWGWALLKFPNQQEIAAFNPDETFQPKGLVIVCFYKCDWGKCPAGEVTADGFKEGKWKMTLNDKVVTELSQTDQCWALKTAEHGYYNKPDNGRQEYELKVWIGPEGSQRQFVRITSIILL